jgi:hypothetical protein
MRFTYPKISIAAVVAAKAVTWFAAPPVPRKISPGTIKVKPVEEGMLNLIRSEVVVAPPNSTVNTTADAVGLDAYNQTSSKTATDVRVAWIVVPNVAVATTEIPRPLVDPESGTLLICAMISPN